VRTTGKKYLYLYKGKRSITCVQTEQTTKENTMQKAIAYYRVSTKRQKRSGLGLEAQQRAVADFARANDFLLIEEYVEIMSGRRNKRQGLQAALAACKKDNALLLIAKLDRLSRSVAFISTLMESRIDFKAIDAPFADKFTIHILAAVAEKEREDTSLRTIAALAAAKRRGVILGKNGRNVLSIRNKERAIKFAEKMRPLIQKIRKRGIKTMRGITEELNRLHIPTFSKQDAQWHPNTVYRLLTKINKQ
jgi:DNA invertase Pin-like site-specific DNA recombinase